MELSGLQDIPVIHDNTIPSCNQNSLLDLLLWPQLQYKDKFHDDLIL